MMALGQLEATLTSSSADGEQPKFLTHIIDENRSVLVKFSPAIDSAVGRRIADLLVCECLALETLRQAGLRAAACDVLEYGDRVFLESTRFDRTPEGGRRPLHSLFSLAAQHTGLDKGWYETSVALVTLGVLSPQETKTVATLETFGHLIANSDMHLHNLAFESHQGRVTRVAPSYDMLPMLFYPQSHNVSEPEWSLDGPTLGRIPREAWMEARPLAEFFWQRVAKSELVSAAFRHVAAAMADKVSSLAGLLARLPASGATR
jgi:hypothetical protein